MELALSENVDTPDKNQNDGNDKTAANQFIIGNWVIEGNDTTL